MTRELRRSVAGLLVLVITLSVVARPSQGAVLASDAGSTDEREKTMHAIQRADVRAELMRLGADPDQVEARVSALSDAEIAQLARRIDAAPAGGDAELIATVLIYTVVLVAMGLVLLVKGIAHVANAAFESFVAEDDRAKGTVSDR